MKWRTREVVGDMTEIVADVLLEEPPGSFVVITDGAHPEEQGDKVIIVVPQWGEA